MRGESAGAWAKWVLLTDAMFVLAAIGMGVSAAVGQSGGTVAFGVACVLFVTLFIIAQSMARRRQRREFSRGYTTLRRYGSAFRYVSPGEDPSSATPTPPRLTPQGASYAVSMQGSESEHHRNERTSAAIAKRRLIAAILVALIVLVAALRSATFINGEQWRAWYLLAVGIGTIVMIVVLFVLCQSAMSLLLLRRIRGVDEGKIFLGVPSPHSIQRIVGTGRCVEVTPYIALVASRGAVRVWTTAPRPVLLLVKPYGSTEKITLIQTKDGFPAAQPVVVTDDGTQTDIAVSLRWASMPGIRMSRNACGRAIRHMASALTDDISPSPSSQQRENGQQ